MDYQEFWVLVEKHQWLPRILNNFFRALKDSQTDPYVIADFLSLSALKNNVDYIVFHPWESLDLESRPEKDTAEREMDKIHIEGYRGVSYYCYWHLQNENGFARDLCSQAGSEQHINDVAGDITVADLIKVVTEKGGIVDAIVKFSQLEVEASIGETREEKLLNTIFGEGDIAFRRAYDIYLPPS